MNNDISRFLIRISIFTVIIAAVSVAVFYYIFPQYFSTYFLLAILFFFVVTVVFHSITLKASKLRIAQFSNYFMLSSTAKLFIYIILLTIYIFLNKGHAIPFVMFFLILYVFFTFFEVISTSQHLKKINPKTKLSKNW